MKINKDIQFGDMVLRYILDEGNKSMGLTLIPAARLGEVVPWVDDLRERSIEAANLPGDGSAMPASVVDPLVHLKVMGEAYPGGFAQGRTMRGAGGLRYVSQHVDAELGGVVVRTRLAHKNGLAAIHDVRWLTGV
jgi:alpha-galactosidase